MSKTEEMATRRQQMQVRQPPLRCPRCGVDHLQLRDWFDALVVWTCRRCRYEWRELEWGKKQPEAR